LPEDTTGQSGLPPVPLGNNPARPAPRLASAYASPGALQDMGRSSHRCRVSRGFSLSWLFRSGPLRSGQLLCPGNIAPRVVKLTPFTTRGSLRCKIPSPPAASYLSATRKRPAAWLMISPPLRSGATTKVYRG